MKRSPLKRKVSLRDSYLRKLRREGTHFVWNGKRGPAGRELKCKPLKKISRALRERLKVYHALTTDFLLRPENTNCLICTVRREHGENIKINRSTEVHHWALRVGRLLCYVPYFRASCYPCRSWPHENTALAREYGLLAPAAQCGVYPE